MRILLTNDDGIHAPGLRALFKAASTKGDVSVVAPVSEQSGVAHSISVLEPLRLTDVNENGAFFGHGVHGAPADCVRLAVMELLDTPPDIIISGINFGSNVGACVFYSGTVAGAIEGAMLGIPSMAVSIQRGMVHDFDLAAEVAVEAIDILLRMQMEQRGEGIALNINVPARKAEELKGIKITRQGRAGAREGFQKRTDPYGRIYYWGKGELPPEDVRKGDDMSALQEGYVSITPLKCNLTDTELMGRLRAQSFELPRKKTV